MVVLWAYPHRQEELSTYGQYMLGQFLTGCNSCLKIEFDQAACKFVHGHQELYFANISKLGFLSNQIFLPCKQQGGSSIDAAASSSPQGAGCRKNKRKWAGSAS